MDPDGVYFRPLRGFRPAVAGRLPLKLRSPPSACRHPGLPRSITSTFQPRSGRISRDLPITTTAAGDEPLKNSLGRAPSAPAAARTPTTNCKADRNYQGPITLLSRSISAPQRRLHSRSIANAFLQDRFAVSVHLIFFSPFFFPREATSVTFASRHRLPANPSHQIVQIT